MRRSALFALLAALGLAQAASASEHASPTAANSGTGWRDIAVTGAPVALNGPDAVGPNTVFMGGIDITTPDIDRLHGLSDLKFTSRTGFLSVSDEGWLADMKVKLDADGKLIGLEPKGRIEPLLGERGDRLFDRQRRGADNYNTWTDSEGMALMPDGSLLISFEHHQRIWRYFVDKHGPDLPRAMISPPMAIDFNYGFESLATDRHGGYYAASESGGAWHCFRDRCLPIAEVPEPPLIKDEDMRVASLDIDPHGDGLFVLERAYFKGKGNTVRVSLWRHPDKGGFENRELLFELTPPQTTDNMEGIAAMKTGPGGRWTRLYIIADDNFSKTQRTLMMAFDYKPPPAKK